MKRRLVKKKIKNNVIASIWLKHYLNAIKAASSCIGYDNYLDANRYYLYVWLMQYSFDNLCKSIQTIAPRKIFNSIKFEKKTILSI